MTYFVNPPFTWKSNVLAWLLWPDRGNFCNFQMHCIKKECKYWNMKEERFAKPLSRSRLFSTFAWSRNNPRNFKTFKNMNHYVMSLMSLSCPTKTKIEVFTICLFTTVALFKVGMLETINKQDLYLIHNNWRPLEKVINRWTTKCKDLAKESPRWPI